MSGIYLREKLTVVFFALVCVLQARAAAPTKQRVGVLEFTAKGGVSQEQLDVLADLAATELRSTGRFEVVTKSDIQAMLGLERAKELVGCDDASCIAEIGGALGVDLIVAGNAGRFGRLFGVNLKLIDIRRAAVIDSVFRKLEGGVEALLEDMPNAVRELVGLPSRKTQPAQPPPGSPLRAFKAPVAPAEAARKAESRLLKLGFDRDQIVDLRHQRIALDTEAADLIEQLIKRGFPPYEAMVFIEECQLLDKPPERRMDWVLFHLTGWERKYWKEFLVSKKQFSDFYNDYQESAPLEVFKWLLLGFGMVGIGEGALLASGVLFNENTESRRDMTPAELEAEKEEDQRIGYALAGVGGGFIVIFGILLVVDLLDRGHVPPGFFEQATREQILETMPQAADRLAPKYSLSVGPWILSEDHVGMAVGFSF